jgi:hypothetical protein
MLCVFLAGCLGIAVGAAAAKTAVVAAGQMVRIEDMQRMLKVGPHRGNTIALAIHPPAQTRTGAWGDD